VAYRKASGENPAVPLGSEDFWAAVQNGGDVRISVADILAYLRTVLVTGDIAELPGELQAISDKAASDLAALSDQINGSVAQSISDLEVNVETRATKDELSAALGTLDGSVGDKLAALQTDVDRRVLSSQLGAGAGQVPVLGAGGKLEVSTIPAVAITDSYPVASETEMLALDAQRGDIAIRSDLNKCFVLKAEPAATLDNWKELLTPTDAVLSVAGLKGAITATGLKAALAIAIADVSGLQDTIDALTGADAKLRTDFTAADAAEAKARGDADTAIRTDFAAADAAEAKARADADTLIRTDFAAADAAEVKARGDADTAVRGEFAAADTQIRADFAAADATKFDKAGGNVSGNVTASGTVTGNAITAQSNSDAVVYIESYAAPTTSYRRKAIFSSTNVGGGNDWLFRAYRPSDGANQDWVLKSGTGGTIWTSGNFDPATKINLAGGTFTGAIAVRGDSTYGSVSLVSGSVARTGYMEFKGANGTRQGYIGNGDGTTIDIQAENGAHYNFNGAAPTILGNTVWHAGTFDPASKANVAGQTFTGAIAAPGITTSGNLNLASGAGSNFFKAGALDGASYSDANIRLHLHNGMVIETYDGSVQGFYDARAGRWDTKAAPRVNGVDVWHPGNFDPATKLGLATGGTVTNETVFVDNSGGTFASRVGSGNALMVRAAAADGTAGAGMTFHRPSAHAVWFGLDTDNEFVRGGWSDGAVRYKFWTEKNFNPGTKANLTGADFTGNITTTGKITVGVGQTSSIIEMSDTDEGMRYIHNNSSSIGFLGSDGTWKFRVYDNGNVWSSMYGYLSDYVNARASAYAGDRVAKTGDTMTGPLYIDYNYPQLQLTNRDANGFPYIDFCHAPYGHSDYTYRLKHNSSDNSIYFDYVGNGTRFAIRSDGSIWCAQLGDINTRIENRAAAYADDRKNGVVNAVRWAYAGDLDISWNGNAGYSEPYSGAAVTGGKADNSYGTWNLTGRRFRTLQILVPNQGWINTYYG
jgi:hypothetical protein